MGEGSPHVWLTCMVINVQGKLLYGGGEPSCVAHVHGNYYYIWWRGTLTCGN